MLHSGDQESKVESRRVKFNLRVTEVSGKLIITCSALFSEF